MKRCEIQWIDTPFSKATPNIHKKHCNSINLLNILQSTDYARAIANIESLRPRLGLITINDIDAGIFQLLEVGILKNLFHALILDRGPVWFEGFENEENFIAFMTTFKKKYPKRLGRRIRLIPEIEYSDNIHNFLIKQGYKRSESAKSYKTPILNLTQDENVLLENMKKKWRNALTKSQKQNLTIECDVKGEYFKWMMQNYALDKAQKQYDGPSVKLMQAMAKHFCHNKNMMILRALKDNKPIAGILLFIHEPSATYQIGWTSPDGRNYNAHNLLLWEAVRALKKRYIKTLDLGGMNDEDGKNIKKFKDGLGGHTLTLPGLYT